MGTGWVSRATRKTATFGASSAILAIAGLLFIRAATSTQGLVPWASVAVGQAVGALGAVIVGYGWGSTGPALVARLGPTDSRLVLLEALKLRSVLLGPAVLVVGALTFTLPAVSPQLAFLGALPTLTGALSSNFYFVGKMRAADLLFFDTLARASGTALAIASLHLGAPLEVALALQLAGTIAAVSLAALRALSLTRSDESMPQMATTAKLLARHGDGLVSVSATALFNSLPLMIVSAVAPTVLPAFTVLDKYFKQVSVGLGPLTSTLLGWVPAGEGKELAKRIRLGIGFSVLTGIAVVVASYLAGGSITTWLSSGGYQPTSWELLMASSAVGLAFIQHTTSFGALAPLGRMRAVAVSTLVGAAVGTTGVVMLASPLGVAGAMGAVAMGFGLTASWQIVLALMITSRRNTARWT